MLLLCAVIVTIAAAMNLSSLLTVLYVRPIHPVQHLLLPADAGSRGLLNLGPLALAVILLCGFWILGRAFYRARDLANPESSRTAQAQALIPAALAPAWIVYVLHSPRINLLIVFACILLTGWALARWVRSLSPVESLTADGGTLKEKTGSPDVRWWRERWFLLLITLVLGLTIFHTYVQSKLFHSLQYGGPDIGYYAEMLVNASRGRGLWCEAFGHDFLGEHVSPGLYLLVPLWMCWPDIHLLMILAAASVCGGSLAVYALARSHDASPRVAAVLAAAFLLTPSTSRIIYGASYGFHEILLAVPLMLWSFYCYHRRYWWRMALFALLALSFKENIAVVYGCFGLYVFIRDRRDRWGLIVAAGCLIYFALAVGWIVPAINKTDTYSKYYLYEGLGGSPTHVLTSFVRDPSHVFNRLCSWQTLGYVLSLSVPVGLLVIRRPLALVAIPTLAFTCLMDNPAFASIRFWHQCSALPVLWFATIQAVATPTRGRFKPAHLAVGLLWCAALTHYSLGFSMVSRTWRDLPLHEGNRSELIDRLHNLIPAMDDVQATPRLAAHFYAQAHSYPLHAGSREVPRWVIIDTADSFTPRGKRDAIIEHRDRLLSADRYELVLRDGTIHVFKRRE